MVLVWVAARVDVLQQLDLVQRLVEEVLVVLDHLLVTYHMSHVTCHMADFRCGKGASNERHPHHYWQEKESM
jgi:hypothetical protein